MGRVIRSPTNNSKYRYILCLREKSPITEPDTKRMYQHIGKTLNGPVSNVLGGVSKTVVVGLFC